MKKYEETVLLTGGAGFIGSHVVEELVHRGYRVINLDLLTYAGNLENLAAVAEHDRHIFIRGDICDHRVVSKALAEYRPTRVLNIAAESHVDRSIDDASDFIRTNVSGVCCLLECSLDYWKTLESRQQANFRFIQMSTDEVYGSIAVGAFTEESNYAPNSPYAASKAAGDHMVRAYGVTFGLPTIVVHASNTYGPRQYPEKLIPHMIISALAGRALPVYGQGLNVRDWMHVDDLARGLACVLERGGPGEIYNFSGRDEAQNIKTVRRICRHLDRVVPATRPYDALIKFVPDRPGHDGRYAMRIDKVKRDLEWEPQSRFKEGLPAVVGWYLENRGWWEAVLSRGYHGTRLGLRAGRVR
jgi:dTDP-glucose 4,6-dehydratase